MYFPHLVRALTTMASSTNLWLNPSYGHCRAYQQMQSRNLQKKGKVFIEKLSSNKTNPFSKPSLGFSAHIGSRTFVSFGSSKPGKVQRPETAFDRVSEFPGHGDSFHDFLEIETHTFFEELEKLSSSGNKTGDKDLLRANHEAAKEKMNLRPLNFKEVTFVSILALRSMNSGDSEFVGGSLLEMLTETLDGIKASGIKSSEDLKLLCFVQISLGNMYLYLKKFDESETMYRSVVSRIGYTSGQSRVLLVEPYLGIARSLAPNGKEMEAIEYYRRVIMVLESLVGSEDEQLLKPLYELANLLWKLGKSKEAETEFLRLLKLETKFGQSNEARMSMFGLAYVNRDMGNMDEAIGWCKKALEGTEDSNDTSRDDTQVEDIRIFLADFLGDLGRESECREILKEWLAMAEKSEGKETMRSAKYMVKLGWSHLRSFNFTEAEHFLRESLEIMAKIANPDVLNLLYPMMSLSFALYNLGRSEEAEKLALEARRIKKEAFEEGSLQANVLKWFNMVQGQIGRNNEDGWRGLRGSRESTEKSQETLGN